MTEIGPDTTPKQELPSREALLQDVLGNSFYRVETCQEGMTHDLRGGKVAVSSMDELQGKAEFVREFNNPIYSNRSLDNLGQVLGSLIRVNIDGKEKGMPLDVRVDEDRDFLKKFPVVESIYLGL
jgi:hypothetical protein